VRIVGSKGVGERCGPFFTPVIEIQPMFIKNPDGSRNAENVASVERALPEQLKPPGQVIDEAVFHAVCHGRLLMRTS
jgi:hypothetical protein